MEIKLLVGIPTINRADLLNEALVGYYEDFPNTEIFIVDNGHQDLIIRENRIAVYKPQENLNVTGSWNLIMDYAKKTGHTHVLLLNDDVYLGRTEYQVKTLIKANSSFGFFNSMCNWSAFVLSLETYQKVGPFDFVNYFNDNDYFYRMQLLGVPMFYTEFLNPKIYRNSMTIAKDPSLNAKFGEYQNHYIQKWGGMPGKETYTTPFNL